MSRPLAVCLALSMLIVAACGSSKPSAPTPTAVVSWVDQPVTFTADSMTIYGTYRHPVGATGRFPAALIIAGSGPTNRDGNSAVEPGPIDTLKTVADWLSADGVASLRYDKLGTGQTGLGPYASAVATIGLEPYEHEAAAALTFLAAQPGVDADHLAVVGHSEGALFALLLARGMSGTAPAVHALVLLEPLSGRYLGVISEQFQASVAKARGAGTVTATAAATLDNDLAKAISTLRSNGSVPPGLPPSLTSIFNSSNALFLSQADRFDPGVLAAGLAPRFPVLVTCSNADVQVSCADVDHLAAGLTTAQASTTYLHLQGTDHVLKQDPTGSATNYTESLPFSPQLQSGLATFVHQHL